jgi:hypothetical protein
MALERVRLSNVLAGNHARLQGLGREVRREGPGQLRGSCGKTASLLRIGRARKCAGAGPDCALLQTCRHVTLGIFGQLPSEARGLAAKGVDTHLEMIFRAVMSMSNPKPIPVIDWVFDGQSIPSFWRPLSVSASQTSARPECHSLGACARPGSRVRVALLGKLADVALIQLREPCYSIFHSRSPRKAF